MNASSHQEREQPVTIGTTSANARGLRGGTTIAVAQGMTTNLTAAERRTLGNILALGGTSAVTQGRNWTGTIRKSVVASLQRRGLVEGIRLAGECAITYYATAAGCAAFGPEIARVS